MRDDWYLPEHMKGKITKNGGLTKNNPRRWTDAEINWMNMLKDKGCTLKMIAEYLGRDVVSVQIKSKRLQKRTGEDYNAPHREHKEASNDEFLALIQPKSVLDLYAGANSFYQDKVNYLETNDIDITFGTYYSENAEKLVHDLYYKGARYDLIDLDPFGSAYECFDCCIKMARNGLVITLGEMGHKRFRRLDYVRRMYNIDKYEDFNSENIVKEIIKIGARNKKRLVPYMINDYRHISRVYFKIEKFHKILEQWEK